jgi:hypothetical protein
VREKEDESFVIVNATKIIALTFHPLNLGISFGREVIRVVLIRVIPKLPFLPSTKTMCFNKTWANM